MPYYTTGLCQSPFSARMAVALPSHPPTLLSSLQTDIPMDSPVSGQPHHRLPQAGSGALHPDENRNAATSQSPTSDVPPFSRRRMRTPCPPTSFVVKPAAPPPLRTGASPPTSSRGRPTSRPLSRTLRTRTASLFPPGEARVGFLTVFKHPRILTSLLAQLSWPTCWVILNTCHDCRNFFSCPELVDVILSRFVPWYWACADLPESLRLKTVPSTVADLHIRMTSQTRKAHNPLSSALKHPRIVAVLIEQLSWQTCWALLNSCRDHRDLFSHPPLKVVVLSRFVPGYSECLRHSDPLRLQVVPVTLADLNLLMVSQSVILHRYLMHALTRISRDTNSESEQSSIFLVALAQAHSRFVLLLQALAHSSSLPQLPDREEIDCRSPSAKPKLRQLNFPPPLSYVPIVVSKRTHATLRPARLRKGTDSSDDKSQSTSPRSLSHPGRRLSLFMNSGPKVPLPPPVSEPRSLRHYSSGWRTPFSRASSSASEDEWGYISRERPHLTLNLYRQSSSYSDSPSPPLSRDSTMETVSPVRRDISHHDLSLATSRTRAPVLRVFVPCSKLDSKNIALCEDQLRNSGLWSYLSVGDVVCNLGYVPPPDEPGSSDGDSAGSENTLQNRRKWLLFNGESLVPFSLPESLPLSNPFILPSPFYYFHVMRPQTNPVFAVRCFPPCDDTPQLTLLSSSVKVRSPHSPTGYALVQKSAWTARVWKPVAQEEEVGLGWQGEWVLEGDGTPEGQKVLIDCLRGVKGPLREWELLREKSGGDRLWFRQVPTTTCAPSLSHVATFLAD
ncbi:hypothetical protein GGX14DRAFT_418989 [Mycena pura]|uniref:Uncharacterized protein n=1 Tax=Mycena pura TaxID=153505 RepID=A0AAD6YRY2_9AGAR|nr:hypothetical protein GGX14DRAFT_418989 [Mycena pura]